MRAPERPPAPPPEAQAFARDRSLRAVQELDLLMRWGSSATVRIAAALALLRAGAHIQGSNDATSLIKFFSAISVDDPDVGPNGMGDSG